MDEERDIYGPDERADDEYHDLKDNGLLSLPRLRQSGALLDANRRSI